jgi:Outer membrane protein beta-barrel domain
MKKFLLIFICLSIIKFSSAQTFGIRGGLNIANQRWVINNKVYRPTAIAAPHIGITLHHAQNKEKITSQLEAYYSVIGDGEFSGYGSKAPEEKLKYVGLAVMLKVHPATKEFDIHFGPQLSFFVGDKDYLGEMDLSIGLGGERYFGKNFGLGARYNFGITDLNKDSNDIVQRSRTIQLSLLLRFNSRQLKEEGY